MTHAWSALNELQRHIYSINVPLCFLLFQQKKSEAKTQKQSNSEAGSEGEL